MYMTEAAKLMLLTCCISILFLNENSWRRNKLDAKCAANQAVA